MDLPRENTLSNLFSTYKRTAGIAFAAILIVAIPVTLGLLNQQQDVRQRASETDSSALASPMCEISPACAATATPCIVATPAEGWCPASTNTKLLAEAYKWVGHCTAGCEGDTNHLLYVSLRNVQNGAFKGSGYYIDDPTTTWNIKGIQNLTTNQFTYELIYTGRDAGYVTRGSGRVNQNGDLEGELSTTQNQRGTFVATRITCNVLPSGCTITTATGTPQCEAGISVPTLLGNAMWCPKIKDVPVVSEAAIFDLNDDGRLSAVDLNILYSNFSKRQGD